MIVQIPNRLNGKTFYEEVLPVVYYSIINEDYNITFDMTKTELANPEGIINLLVTALMIRNKYNSIPYLAIPKSEELQSYLNLTGFFAISKDYRCQVFSHDFQPIGINVNEKYKKFIPKIYGIFANENNNSHFDNVDKILKNIQIQFGEKTGFSTSIQYELKLIYDLLHTSISQLIKNVLEHNQKNNHPCLGYYMAQKTPYNTIEIVFSDCGIGYWKRILEMLEQNIDHDGKLYRHREIESKLKTNEYVFKKHQENPNLVAIEAAVNYRNDSKIPGIYQIMRYALDREGRFFIHSGNYSRLYSNESNYAKFHEDSYFSGSHIKVEIPLNY